MQRGTHGDGTGFGRCEPHRFIHRLLLQDISLSASYAYLLSSYTPLSKSSCQGTNSPHLWEHYCGSCTLPAPASGCDYSVLPADSEAEITGSLEDHGLLGYSTRALEY